ncbi:MarR family winged helix-turn-helix transcriptional regulator [Modicisalibacter radicis]|uniref:MarR family winged helix-turn-helix transcriptional regulator n=1 Tax=Halomonas sp. EAR18 TaxID=2518972 RepID=UPI00109CAE14|nr:MarR family winged helix-turn-helix transcriptional regulator [Halomonas sp. EAR18]
MTENDHKASPQAEALTALILSLFRVNNLTINWGDRLVAPLGLTSARWQILGAIAYADRPRPVAWLARDLGANRQNIQRIVNDLHKDGIVSFTPNPHHKRAHLVVLTVKGRRVYDEALRLYVPRANALAEDISSDDLEAARRVMDVLKIKLEGNGDAEEQV